MQQVNYPPIEHIELRDGQARVKGRQVKVKMVISRLLYGTGARVEEVMEQYNLTRAEVLACLSYYYDYQVAIENHFDEQERALHETALPLDELMLQIQNRQHKQP